MIALTMQLLAAVWLVCVIQTEGHSWVEQLAIVKDGLLQIPPGYPRGYGKPSCVA